MRVNFLCPYCNKACCRWIYNIEEFIENCYDCKTKLSIKDIVSNKVKDCYGYEYKEKPIVKHYDNIDYYQTGKVKK